MQSIASLQASVQSISRFSNPCQISRGPLQIHSLLLGLILLFSTFSTAGFSQDAPQKPARVDQPLLLFQVANVETLENHGRTLFEKCERPDMIPAMEMWLKNDLKELKGVDRTRPLGMMMYLGDILTEPMWAATFIPVTNVDEFLGWMCSMPHSRNISKGRRLGRSLESRLRRKHDHSRCQSRQLSHHGQ